MALTILPPVPDFAPLKAYYTSHASPQDSDTSMSDSDIDHRPSKRVKLNKLSSRAVVVPGERITEDTQWMRGHGTTTNLSPSATLITATLAGPVTTTNKLLSVLPIRARYIPEVGDLVLGRIVSVEKSQWRVDVAAPLLAKLSMSSINLPGGALRRRTANDELQMRRYFQEGDLLVAEVQQISGSDGSATLHARSLRYGKLRNGVFLAVSGSGGVVRSRRQQFTVGTGLGAGEVDVILGVNGYVWLSKHVDVQSTAGGVDLSISNLDEVVSTEAYSSQNDMIEEGTRREMARLSEVIKCLAEGGVRVDEDSVRKGYEVAVEVALANGADAETTGKEMLEVEVRRQVVEGVLAG